MKNRLIIMLLFSLCFFFSCKKQGLQRVPVNAALKAAFNYKPGTYWIYKDSISGRVDSFFVRSNSDMFYPELIGATGNGTGNPNESIEIISIIISEFNINPLSAASDTQHWQFGYQETMFCVSSNNTKLGQIQYTPLVNYPFQTTLMKVLNSDYPENDIIDSIYTTFSIGVQTFSNVTKINNNAYINYDFAYLTAPYSYNDWFYICPSVGLIKIVLNHPQDSLYRVWEIQRWNIVK